MASEQLKDRQRAMWGSGSYQPLVERYLLDLHDRFTERLAPRPGERLLDVATGTGAIALRAARAGADVTALDLAPELVETARRLAAEDGLAIRFDVGDAESLPYEDGSFDVVCSAIGTMFAPDHAAVARELARVCRPGGRLALVSWSPVGGVAEQFQAMKPFQPAPPPGVGNPFDWGDPQHVRDLLGGTFDLELIEDRTMMEGPSAEEMVAVLESHYGPHRTLAESLDGERRPALHQAVVEHFERYRANGRISRPSPYLVVLGTRRSG